MDNALIVMEPSSQRHLAVASWSRSGAIVSGWAGWRSSVFGFLRVGPKTLQFFAIMR
jgi:hypothetical protein